MDTFLSNVNWCYNSKNNLGDVTINNCHVQNKEYRRDYIEGTTDNDSRTDSGKRKCKAFKGDGSN